jgi:V/A-type H+-transporting ATPase subunit I
MPWHDAVAPLRMARVALVAPERSLRDMLVAVAAAATVEIDDRGTGQNPPGGSQPGPAGGEPGPARGEPASAGDESRPAGGQPGPAAAAALPDGRALVPALAAEPPDLGVLRRTGRFDLLAGEAALQAHARAALRGQGACALAGWVPASRVPGLTARLAGIGCAVVPLPSPPGLQPPTLLAGRPARRAVAPLVSTYGTVPYADLDPTWLAWASYVLMFGMMFGDAGHGLLLLAAALCLHVGWPRWARGLRGARLFVGGAGLAAIAFGVAYGEFFGPTGLLPALWLEPLSRPIPLLAAAVGAGAVLLACAYALGTVNRWREGGWRLALYAPSGLAGSALFLGIGLAAGGWYVHYGAALAIGAAVAVAGLALALAGFAADAGGGATGGVQSVVELFDMVIRLGSNVVSFARLAAFGLTHAAIGLLVWEGARALWHRGGAFAVLAVLLFLVGNAVAFALEALVAAIQALRLEYYELFSRVFTGQGRTFRPWCVRVVPGGEGPAAAARSAPVTTGDLVPGKRGV